MTRLKNLFYGTSLILGFGLIYAYLTDTRASAHRWLVIPALRFFYPDPEDAHEAGNYALKSLWQFGLYPRERGNPDASGDLSIKLFGHNLSNPIGTSAGIDKHADIPDVLLAIGPSIIEIGGTTPLPQSGNPYPRVFRLPSQNALINRYGLNSEGADHIAMRLRHRVRQFADSLNLGHDEVAEQQVLNGHAGVPPGSLIPGKLLAVNIAKNKFTPETDVAAVTADYVYCVEQVGRYADILVVNVSSPNTPGLRTLQRSEPLRQILTGVVDAAKKVDRAAKPAVMVKVSPDEDSDEQIMDICAAVWASGVDGVVVGNTTNRRPEPLGHLPPMTPFEKQQLLEQGGFSGPHLFERTLSLVGRYRELLNEPPDFSPEEQSSNPTKEPTQSQPPARSAGKVEEEATKMKDPLLSSSPPDVRSHHPDDTTTASIDTGVIPAPTVSQQSTSTSTSTSPNQPLLQLPTSKHFSSPSSPANPTPPISQQSTSSTASASSSPPQNSPKPRRPLPIFATGGITTGSQAQQVLDAGADVAMLYTALVYGGIGTVSRVKGEMREARKERVGKGEEKGTGRGRGWGWDRV